MKICRWEYRTVTFSTYKPDYEIEGALNEAGRHGWELVTTSPMDYGLLVVLKRPKGEYDHRLDFVEGSKWN